MESTHHSFSELFCQLGLPSDAASVAAFLTRHAPLPPDLRLSQAPFWTAAQAAFLREAIEQDSDWAELADRLSAALRAPGS